MKVDCILMLNIINMLALLLYNIGISIFIYYFFLTIFVPSIISGDKFRRKFLINTKNINADWRMRINFNLLSDKSDSFNYNSDSKDLIRK